MSVRAGDRAVDALQSLPAGFDVVVDEVGEPIGTVNDIDVRRALLATDDPDALRVADVLGPADAPRPTRIGDDAIVVVMAGGRGERLRPLTDHLPKPLLAVGRTTILERLLERLFESGFGDVWLAVNYMADKIESTIGDGARWGMRVRYLREDEPLHTAGALSLLPERPTGPIVVLNADQVTRLSFARMVDYHQAEGAAVTIGVFFHEEQVKYGVVDLDGNAVVGMREKPTLRWPCNAGFYVIDPAMLDLVPQGQAFSMVDLADAAMAAGHKVVAFPIVETWLDIGNFDDLNNALMWFVTGEEL
ncbi:MAG: hddC [Actinomycetia bacterium]|nr:hddC [Actinomycetes bacterium]